MRDGDKFLDALQRKAKLLYPAVKKTVDGAPDDCYWLLDPLARWTESGFGVEAFDLAARGYARYAMEVNRLQQAYESSGEFSSSSHEEVVEAVYDNPDYMIPYMWAAVLIYPYWPSMVRHIAFLRDRFIRRLPEQAEILELACGHGALGLLALEEREDLRVEGVDLSPAAIEIAMRLRQASGHGARSTLGVMDALDLQQAGAPGRYAGVLAAMLAEHLHEPERLFRTIAHHLAPEGICFFSTALESAQKDHVYEFHTEAQVLAMAAEAGLRVVDLICDGPRRPGARYRPRAMAAILEHQN
ncbi:class I SAM-dependent methyltransferase [Castellaniella ginsengisoli]|uniref:Class I SAM-dependent methyltransferase n=1 Tax=Castellaniella ginsengisoli TaxID=546114 RepID=A0AB39CGA9_9BURK